MAKKSRSKASMASNIKNKVVAVTPNRYFRQEKSAERTAYAFDQIANVMNMMKDIMEDQEGVFRAMLQTLQTIPESTEEEQKINQNFSKQIIEAILKLEKQLENETDVEKKEKIQGAINVLKTQGRTAQAIANPQVYPATFSQSLQSKIFGISPRANEAAGGFFPAMREKIAYDIAAVKTVFGVYPKNQTFDDILAKRRSVQSAQDKVAEIQQTFGVDLTNKKIPEIIENSRTIGKSTVLPKETLVFYDNVMEGLNIIVMNQDKMLGALNRLTPDTSDDTTTSSPNPAQANAVPDLKVTYTDDMISGYGKRVLLTPTKAYALNNADDIVAGTNLFPKGSIQLAPRSSSAETLLSTGSTKPSAEALSMRTSYPMGLESLSPASNNTVNAPTVNNIDNSTKIMGGGAQGGGANVTFIRDVYSSHMRYQEKRLSSLFA